MVLHQILSLLHLLIKNNAMKYVAIFLLFSLSYSLSAQNSKKFIDHDLRFGAIKGMHATDSLIYYIQSFTLSHGSSFSAIDNNGTITRTEIHNHNWGTPKFYDYKNDSLAVLYYNNFDFDHYSGDILEHRFYDGISTIKNWEINAFETQDVDINKAGNLLTILNPSSLVFFDEDQSLLHQIELDESFGYYKLVRVANHGVLLIGRSRIAMIKEDFSLQNLYVSTSEIRSVMSGNADEVFIIFNDKVEIFDLITLDKNVLFNHDYENFESVKFSHDRFVFQIKENDNHQFYTINNNGSEESLLYENEFVSNFTSQLYFDIQENSLHLSYEQQPINPIVFSRIPIFESIYETPVEDDCVDISLDYASVYRTGRIVIFVDTIVTGPMDTTFREYNNYLFIDTLVVTNQGSEIIEFFDIHSSDVYPLNSNASHYAHYTFRGYNLDIGETRMIIDSFNVPFSGVPFTEMGFIVPGGNHLLDCFPDDNTYSDLEILTGIKSIEEEVNFDLYPNPVNDQLFIKNNTKTIPFAIYDLSGKEILNGKVNNYIDVSDLSEGMYFIRLEHTATKFIKI